VPGTDSRLRKRAEQLHTDRTAAYATSETPPRIAPYRSQVRGSEQDGVRQTVRRGWMGPKVRRRESPSPTPPGRKITAQRVMTQ
jgi:hypothetical protein